MTLVLAQQQSRSPFHTSQCHFHPSTTCQVVQASAMGMADVEHGTHYNFNTFCRMYCVAGNENWCLPDGGAWWPRSFAVVPKNCVFRCFLPLLG